MKRSFSGAIFGTLVILIVLALVSSAPTLIQHKSSSQVAAPEWPTLGNNVGRTSQSSYPGSTNNLTKWIFSLPGGGTSQPVIDQNGVVYLAWGNSLYAIDPDGSLEWSENLGYATYTPSIAPDGVIYIPTVHGVSAIFPNGTLYWSCPGLTCKFPYPLNESISANNGTSLAIGKNGVLYSVNQGVIYAIYPDGRLEWNITLSNCDYGSTAIGPDGDVYCRGGNAVDNSYLYAMMPSKTLHWDFFTGGGANPTDLTPVVDGSGNIYAPSANGSFFALNPTGKVEWDLVGMRGILSNPALAPDGSLYVTGERYNYQSPEILQISNGVLEAQYRCYAILSTPGCNYDFGTITGITVDQNGILYLSEQSTNGSSSALLAFNPVNSELEWQYTLSPSQTIVSAPSMDANGTLYFAAEQPCASCPEGESGFLYAVGNPTNSPLVTFSPEGLPATNEWFVNFGGVNYTAVTNSSLVFSAPAGSYNWSIYPSYVPGAGERYISDPVQGQLNISSSATQIALNFSSEYEVLTQTIPASAGNLDPGGQNWYFPGSTANLTETANSGYHFDGWSSNSLLLALSNSSSANTRFVVNGTGIITASYDLELVLSSGQGGSISYTAPPSSGTVTSGNSTILYLSPGEEVALTVRSQNGYTFRAWSGSGEVSQQLANPYIFQLNVPTILTANFLQFGSSNTTSQSTRTVSSTLFSSTSGTSSSRVSTSSSQASSSSASNLLNGTDWALLAVPIIVVGALLFAGFLMIRRRK